jgi:TorA maturation chaperone TorD
MVMAEGVPGQEDLARLLFCRFLTNGFNYPEADLLEILSTEVVWEELALADDLLGLEADSALVELREWQDTYEGDRERLLLDLQVEYTYLFITARPHVPAPPYESAYSGRGYLMGEPVSQVLAVYREAGLAMHRDYDALPDHVAAELEFVSYLIQQEVAARESGDATSAEEWRTRQQRFLEGHLLRWGPSFLDRVAAGARKPFYRLLAKVARTLFSVEEQRFAMTSPSSAGIEEEKPWLKQC